MQLQRIEDKLDEVLTNQTKLLAYARKEQATMSNQSDALRDLKDMITQVENDEALDETQTAQVLSELKDLRMQLKNLPADDTTEIQAITARMAALDARLQALRQGEIDADADTVVITPGTSTPDNTVQPIAQPPAQNVPVDGPAPPAETPRETASQNTTVDAANAAGVDTSQLVKPQPPE